VEPRHRQADLLAQCGLALAARVAKRLNAKARQTGSRRWSAGTSRHQGRHPPTARCAPMEASQAGFRATSTLHERHLVLMKQSLT